MNYPPMAKDLTCSGGPKNYAYKVFPPKTNRVIMKLKSEDLHWIIRLKNKLISLLWNDLCSISSKRKLFQIWILSDLESNVRLNIKLLQKCRKRIIKSFPIKDSFTKFWHISVRIFHLNFFVGLIFVIYFVQTCK